MQLKENLLPWLLEDKLYYQMIAFKQDSLPALEYMQKFEKMSMRCDTSVDEKQTHSHFKNELQADIPM